MERIAEVDEEVVVLRVAGEIDLRAHAALDAALADATHVAAHLVVDLSAVTFISARGLILIADGATAAAAAGTRFAVSGLPARLEHIALLLWHEDVPRRYPTTAAALTSSASSERSA